MKRPISWSSKGTQSECSLISARYIEDKMLKSFVGSMNLFQGRQKCEKECLRNTWKFPFGSATGKSDRSECLPPFLLGKKEKMFPFNMVSMLGSVMMLTKLGIMTKGEKLGNQMEADIGSSLPMVYSAKNSAGLDHAYPCC